MQTINKPPKIITPPLPKPLELKSFAKNEWEKVLSDHAGQMMSITRSFSLLTWNIMTMGRGGNNAYRKAEDAETEYKPRLFRIAEQLAKQAKIHSQLGIIALQEAPYLKEFKNYFYATLRALFPSNWIINPTYYQRSKGSHFGTLFLFNHTLFSEPLIETLPSLTYHNGRMFAVSFIKNSNKKRLTIINAHLRYESANRVKILPSETAKEIQQILNIFKEPTILAGDLNQPTEIIATFFPNHCFFSQGMTSLYFEPSRSGLLEQNIDAFIVNVR